MIITRFAPSPTGYLHIGGARTALFNWLFTRHHGGKFILRIDDTDQARQNDAAVDALIAGLKWIGVDWDEGPIFQHQRLAHHTEIAMDLLAKGLAYRCYATAAELEEMRSAANKLKRPPRYDGRWRDRDASEAPADSPFVIRLKAPQSGVTKLPDMIMGQVAFQNADLDDLILLRADGSPTYMLSTVVDDHDLAISHVIRGNEHFTNTARQLLIYQALGWSIPEFAHIPLIHAADGTKLSKRHGAVGVEHYQAEGFLPLAMVDYLSRLGWTHGIEDYISSEERIRRFDMSNIGKGPARFDLAKLSSVNFHYLKTTADNELARLVAPFLATSLGRELTAAELAHLELALPSLKERAKTLVHLAETAAFYFRPRPLALDEAAAALINDQSRPILKLVLAALTALPEWNFDSIETALHGIVASQGIKFPQLAQPVRAAITGRTNSPGIGEVLARLGRDEALARLSDAL